MIFFVNTNLHFQIVLVITPKIHRLFCSINPTAFLICTKNLIKSRQIVNLKIYKSVKIILEAL